MKEIKGNRFALVLTTHRLWGKIFIPYIVQNEINKKYFRLSECLSPYPSDDTLRTLDQNELELVRIINEYSDKSLFKLFSKDKNVKDFLENVTSEKIEKFIRPYIEKRIRKCFFILKDDDIPCFNNRVKSSAVHSNDMLDITLKSGKPVFRFDRNEEQCSYKLIIEAEGKPIELFKNPIDILSNSPCIIREGNRLLAIENIDGIKLKPFISKESVIIPKKSEIKYFSGFVLNAVSSARVEGTGFRIETPEPEKKAYLSLEQSIKGYPVLILGFSYSGCSFSPDDQSVSQAVFENNDGNFIFRKYKRDFKWETGCLDMLAETGLNTDDSINYYLKNDIPEISESLHKLIEFINRNYNELTENGFEIISGKLERNYNLEPVTIEIVSNLADDWFDLKATIRIGKWDFPFSRFRSNILNGIRDFELPDGKVAILPEEWFTRYRNILEFGKVSGDSIKIHKQHFSILPDLIQNKESDLFRKLEKLMLPGQLPAYSKPAGLKCEMRKYQGEGISWLLWLQSSGLGGCLADDMGLGKTLQALSLLQINIETITPPGLIAKHEKELTLFDLLPQNLTSLIIVPATLIHNWANEIKKFVPGMKVYSHSGSQRTRTADQFKYYDIIISSYHTVRQDIELISSFKFHYVILDESQTIKNPSSLVYKSVTRLNSDHRLVLTGTPVENSLSDLWAQLNFVNPGLLGSLAFFNREFARPIEKNQDFSKEAELKKIINPFILRRKKEMVAGDLPPVTEQIIFCDMTEEQNTIYEKEKSAVRNTILNSITAANKENTAIAVLQGLMKLRQISNHPVIADEGYHGESGKFVTVLNDIENVVAEGHKILVFSSFVMHLMLYEKALENRNIKFSMLTGSSTNRGKIVNDFQNDPEDKVFLISLKAGGLGLNLTAADYVFILDPWWNPASEMQALNRAHRIGQDKRVFVYKYISTGTLEEKIQKLQEKKSKLAESFIESTNPIKDINIQQILEILG